ncbi:hypothetical protein R3P38DRAFT_3335754 [Favolaschia claudopus]|uniref:Uncharacterized protein n=1 Tax=Favolaschia claudopus TaxID=2862362 RepID=A0AAV9Z8J8_9AGAR
MLFLWLVASLVLGRTDGSSSPSARATDDACNDIHKCRTLYDIVWPCLTTVFACIWVAVHPNMPPRPKEIAFPQNAGRFSVSWCRYQFRRVWDGHPGLRRKLVLMLIALIAPEIMVGFAARQWCLASRFSKKHGVSLTHGFFFFMGGFVDADGYVIVDEKQLTESVLTAIKAVSEAQIQDKSKRDGLAKLLAITQILRVVAQSLARFNQDLAITSLEVATVAYAVVTTFTWVFWMDKPLDTDTPLRIGDATRLPLSDRQHKRIGGHWQGIYGDESTDVPAFFARCPSHIIKNVIVPIECAVAIAFGAIHCIAWSATFPSTAQKWMWCSSALIVTAAPVPWLVEAIPLSQSELRSQWESLLVGAIGCLKAGGIPLYVIARLFLLVLPFVALRSLEPAVFIDINWAQYIPHL